VSSVRRFYIGIIGDGGVSAVQRHSRSLPLVPIAVNILAHLEIKSTFSPIESAYVTSY